MGAVGAGGRGSEDDSHTVVSSDDDSDSDGFVQYGARGLDQGGAIAGEGGRRGNGERSSC